MAEMDLKLAELKMLLDEVQQTRDALAVLEWDQWTYMPPGSAVARARQLATLGKLAHEKFIDPHIGKLLDDLRPLQESLPYEDDDASLLRVARRDYERATRIPPEFTARLNAHLSDIYMQWVEARPANDFNKVLPLLEKMLDLSRELAQFFPGYEHIADPLIDHEDHGMTAASLRALFGELRPTLAPLAAAIFAREPLDDSPIRRHYPAPGQLAFAEQMVRQMGYDFNRGRVDESLHPFTSSFSSRDVRITTRVREEHLGECLFSDIHEMGHALYELGVDPKFDGTNLSQGTSAGVHESQSRLWENSIGRSRECWEYFYPQLQRAFPSQLGQVPLEAFYRAINKVARSLLRTEADEMTYDLHIMIRFDLELALLEGTLEVRDLPQAWRQRYLDDLGMDVLDDRDGVLQDVHWFSGVIGGAFQGYTLGNIMAAQFYQAALQAHPEIPQDMRQGKYDTLHKWLIENIYRHGRKFTAPELVKRVTGSDLCIEPYIQYLRTKFGELYKL